MRHANHSTGTATESTTLARQPLARFATTLANALTGQATTLRAVLVLRLVPHRVLGCVLMARRAMGAARVLTGNATVALRVNDAQVSRVDAAGVPAQVVDLFAVGEVAKEEIVHPAVRERAACDAVPPSVDLTYPLPAAIARGDTGEKSQKPRLLLPTHIWTLRHV